MRAVVEATQLLLLLVVCRGQSYDFDFTNQRLATLDLELYPKNADKSKYRMEQVKGKFAKAGPKKEANGRLLSMEMNCSSYSVDETKSDEPWIGLVKVTRSNGGRKRCNSIADKIRQAIDGGARAVLLDVTQTRKFPRKLEQRRFDHPIILVQGNEAERLSNLLSSSRRAYMRIQAKDRMPHRIPHPQKTKTNEYFDMGIFMAFFIFVSLICLILLIKIKWKQQRKQSSLSRLARHAISKMETRKFSSMSPTDLRVAETMYMSYVPSFGIRSCAICLEEFTEGQEIRIVPCRHEFHRKCVDPWLLANCTCPLCMLNIVEPLPKIRKVRNRRRASLWHFLLRNRCISSNEQQNDHQLTSPTSPLSPEPIEPFPNSRHIIHQTVSAQTNSPRFPTSSSFSEHLRRASEINELSPVDRRVNARPYRYHRCPLHQKNYRPVDVSTCSSVHQPGYWMGARLLDQNINMPGPSKISNESCSSSVEEEPRILRSPWKSQYDNIDSDNDNQNLDPKSASLSQLSKSMHSLSCATGVSAVHNAQSNSIIQETECTVPLRTKKNCCVTQTQSSADLCCTGSDSKTCTLNRKKLTLSENDSLSLDRLKNQHKNIYHGSTKSLYSSNEKKIDPPCYLSENPKIDLNQNRSKQSKSSSKSTEHLPYFLNKSDTSQTKQECSKMINTFHVPGNAYEVPNSSPYSENKPRAVVVLSDVISDKATEEQIV